MWWKVLFVWMLLFSQSSVFASQCYFPIFPQPLKGSLALLSPAALDCHLQFSLSPKIPPKPPSWTHSISSSATFAIMQEAGESWWHFSLQMETCTSLNQMGAIKASCEKSYCSTSFIISPLHVFQSLPSVLRCNTGLNLEKHVNFLPQLAGPFQIQPHLLKF